MRIKYYTNTKNGILSMNLRYQNKSQSWNIIQSNRILSAKQGKFFPSTCTRMLSVGHPWITISNFGQGVVVASRIGRPKSEILSSSSFHRRANSRPGSNSGFGCDIFRNTGACYRIGISELLNRNII